MKKSLHVFAILIFLTTLIGCSSHCATKDHDWTITLGSGGGFTGGSSGYTIEGSGKVQSWRTASATCGWTAAALSVLHAGLCANTRFAILQYPDADTRAMLQDLEALGASAGHQRVLRLGRSWELAPAIEFYRVTHALNWLDPIVDGPGSWDAAFLSPKDLASRGRLIVWRRYPTTGNTLLVAPDREDCRNTAR